MLPTTLSSGASSGAQGAGHTRSKLSKAHGYFSTYFRRIVKPRQMDFEWVSVCRTQLGVVVVCAVALSCAHN